MIGLYLGFAAAVVLLVAVRLTGERTERDVVGREGVAGVRR
jgi:hypothetical protein